MTHLLPYMFYLMMIALKVDKVISVNWAVVHIPLWVGIPVWFIAMGIWMALGSDSTSGAFSILWMGGIAYLTVGIPIFLVFQIIMIVKLNRGALWSASWRALFSPLFFLFGLLALIAIGWFGFMASMASSEIEQCCNMC